MNVRTPAPGSRPGGPGGLSLLALAILFLSHHRRAPGPLTVGGISLAAPRFVAMAPEEEAAAGRLLGRTVAALIAAAGSEPAHE